MCTSCCVLLHVSVYNKQVGQVAYLLFLASVSPGLCLSTVVELVGPGAVLPSRCALYSRPWGRFAMWKSCGTQGRRRRCAALCHVVAGCVMLFLGNVLVGGVALRRVTCRCVVLRRTAFGRAASHGCVLVLCRGVFCVVSCHVALCVVLWRFVVRCSLVLCCVVLRGCSLGCGVPCFVTLSCIVCCCRVSPCGVLCSCYVVWCVVACCVVPGCVVVVVCGCIERLVAVRGGVHVA